jgi:FixJ family two-component response regulator
LDAKQPERPLSDSSSRTTVHIIDDDEGVRTALARVFKSAGFDCSTYSSTKELVDSDFKTSHACILTDMHIAGERTAELPRLLCERDIKVPVIFMSADDSEHNLAHIDRAGGVGFFRKPVDDQALIDAVKWAIRGA